MIESILFEVYQSRLENRKRVGKECHVCKSPGDFIREGERRIFCSEQCNRTDAWFSTLFSLGHKRVREISLEEVEKVGFLQIPTEIQSYIILMAFDYEILSPEEWQQMVKLRSLVNRNLEGMINTQVFPVIRFVDFSVMHSMSKIDQERLSGLTKFKFGPTRGIPLDASHWKEFLQNLRLLNKLDVYYVGRGESELQIERLTRLSTLYCSHYTDDSTIITLTNLKKLRLMRNVPGVTNLGLRDLSNLTTLQFRKGYTGGITGEGLNRLPSLTKLEVSGNPLFTDYDIHNHLNGLSQLVEIDFSDNEFIHEEHISGLVNLQTLRANNTRTEWGGALQFFPKLTSLYLDKSLHIILDQNGRIQEDYLVNLTTLDISHDYYYSPDENFGSGLSKLVNLENLYMTGTAGLSSQNLNNLTKLRSLALPVDMPAKSIRDLTGLTSLDLRLNTKFGLLDPRRYPHLQKIQFS